MPGALFRAAVFWLIPGLSRAGCHVPVLEVRDSALPLLFAAANSYTPDKQIQIA